MHVVASIFFQTANRAVVSGYIKFSVTLSPPLPATKPVNCDCSACRRFGYLLTCSCLYFPLSLFLSGGTYSSLFPSSLLLTGLVDMPREDVTWHGDSWARLSRYQFNTKEKDQLFCGRCGASVGIDFRESNAPQPSGFGISVSIFFLVFVPWASPSFGNGCVSRS